MKKVSMIFLVIGFIALVSVSNVYSWYTHCVNRSCTATSGALVLYYAETGRGVVPTGVSGLNVSISDFESSERAIASAISKVVSQEYSVGFKETDANKTLSTGAENKGVFSRQSSMSTAKRSGVSKSVDETLNFVFFVADNFCAKYPQGNLGRYLCSMETIYEAYRNHDLERFLAAYSFSKNAESLSYVNLMQPVTPENADLILAKYLSLQPDLSLANIDQKTRNNMAYLTAIFASNEKREEYSKEYAEDMKRLSLLMEPGQTARALHKKDPLLAFAKWRIDANAFAVNDNTAWPLLSDKYLVSIYLTYAEYNPAEKKFYIEPTQGDYARFQKAIASNDQSVKIVTVKKGFRSAMAPFGVLAIGMSAIGVVALFFRRRKKSRKDEIGDRIDE